MLLAVNYHYVQEEGRYPFPGIHPTPPMELRRQIEVLGGDFEFVSGQQVLDAVRDWIELPERACLLTFDDGLLDQYQNAVPVLDSLGVPGVFFICSRPLSDLKALTVHKTHWLRSTRSPEDFWDLVTRTGEREGIALDLDQVDEEAAASQYLYDDPPTRRVKYLLNQVLPADVYARLIDRLFSQVADEKEFCSEFYMGRDQIRELSQRHMVGSHTSSHNSLEAMQSDEMEDDLASSRSFIESILNHDVAMVSYPYGGPTTVSMDVGEAARRCGYKVGITMERCINLTLNDPLLLGRLSTNDAPGGKTPKVHLENGTVSCDAPVSLGRRIHVRE